MGRVGHFATLGEALSAEECDRARRFRAVADRRRFILARGFLRTVLASYLKVAPTQVRFWVDSYGKPGTVSQSGARALEFNLSHSAEVTLCAVTRRRKLGVDIERITPGLEDADRVVADFFSPCEIAQFRKVPAESRTDAFFRCWTRKEAYAKATGWGLSRSFADFGVSLGPGVPPALLTTSGDDAEAGRWSLQEIAAAPGYAASIAVEGHGWTLECWDFAHVSNRDARADTLVDRRSAA